MDMQENRSQPSEIVRNRENGGEKVKNTVKKIGMFVEKNFPVFFAPVLVMLLYTVGLRIYDVYPFGSKYTAASYDLSAQICPFIEHLFDVLDGKSTLTYTYALAGGVDVTGTFLYFFISPFSFLFLIFGDGKVMYASSIVMLCKLAAVAASGAWFAQKLFKGIPDYVCVGVGVVYAYCGYTFVASTYISWVDFLIYMPLCAGAFRHFVKTDKFLPFAILMACCIYTCFSIACFSMFTVFPALVVYALFCVKKERRHKFIAYLCLSFFLAVVIALPVLLPALASYMNGGRGGGLFDKFWKGFDEISSAGIPSKFDSSEFVDSWTTSVYRKWSYILSDSVFLALTVVWFFRKGLKDPFAKFMLVAGVFTLLPTIVDEAMLLMNMGSYMSYALRFGFLNALYFLGGACLGLEGICMKKRCAYDGTPLFEPSAESPQEEELVVVNERGRDALKAGKPVKIKKARTETAYNICSCLLIAIGLLAAVLLGLILWASWYVTTDSGAAFVEKYGSALPVLEWLKNVPVSYAHSTGGVEVVAILFGIVSVVMIIGGFLVANKRVSPRLLSFVMIAVVGGQVCVYNNQMVVGNRSTQQTTLAKYQTLADSLNETDDGYFRVKDYGKLGADENGKSFLSNVWTACAPLVGNTNSFTVFSSMIDEDNFITYMLFGYQGNGTNSYKGQHDRKNRYNRGEAFGDAFLGYKYFFVPGGDTWKEVNGLSYTEKVMTTDENGDEIQMNEQGYYVFENTSVFPSAYRVKDGEFRFVSPNTANSTYRKQNQAALYEFLCGEKPTASTSEGAVSVASVKECSEYLWERAAESVTVEAGKITVQITAEADECLFMNFVASTGYAVTVNGKKAELIDNDLKFLSVALEEGENEVVFTYSSPYTKYFVIGTGAALVVLCAAAFVLKKTKIVDYVAPVVSWTGILLATALVAFFMLLPTGAFMVKLLTWLKTFLV